MRSFRFSRFSLSLPFSFGPSTSDLSEPARQLPSSDEATQDTDIYLCMSSLREKLILQLARRDMLDEVEEWPAEE